MIKLFVTLYLICGFFWGLWMWHYGAKTIDLHKAAEKYKPELLDEFKQYGNWIWDAAIWIIAILTAITWPKTVVSLVKDTLINRKTIYPKDIMK